MPNVKSAKKRVKTSDVQRTRNRAHLSGMKTSIKKVFSCSDPAKAQSLLSEAISALDKYSRRGIVHKNRAARMKTRLMTHVRRLSE